MRKKILEKMIERTLVKFKMLEKLMEDKTRELYLKNEQLGLTNMYLKKIKDSLVDTIIVINHDGTIKTVNRATLDTFAYTEDELLGRHIRMLFEDESFNETIIDHLIKRNSSTKVEVKCLTKKGRKIPVIFSSSIMHDVDGTILGVVCLALDIKNASMSRRKCKNTVRGMASATYRD